MFSESKELINSFKLKERRLSTMVSIGPGNGLLELFLLGNLNSQGEEKLVKNLLLIDVEETETHEHNYKESGSGYASLSLTKKFLELNEVEVNVDILNPKKDPLPESEFDICCSFLSMGFHYPCTEYEEFLMNASAGTLLLFDRRRGAPDTGFGNISKVYRRVGNIDNGKADRLCLERINSDESMGA